MNSQVSRYKNDKFIRIREYMKDDLKIHIENNEIDKAIELIDSLVVGQTKTLTDDLIEILQTTTNNILRNHVAITLSDLRCQEVVVPIIKLLKDPNTEGSRGTLLYALEPLNYEKHVDVLFEVILEDKLEASIQSYILLE